ncbi:RHS repeat-associated core domain-containing protein [Flavobacterium hydatis]|uniref:RHS repeat-associated core domain-containing protein n=1 Tax=Flavobacterium hydatis TaxID=991 RepID=A0A086A044_FLAHY|nr:RHS repeat-associated core domain-containing protein [Flavobacterium hydatis]KFF10058.1 hypothetical protein IW20_21525 [Flavobacterium hydatis]OXA93309.1 RHS repeat-associated core domain-containing protein [Flavobacterium hydatis]
MLLIAQNPTTKKVEILEENNYYPFGLKHQGYNTLNLEAGYKYKYNGKELQDKLGLGFYDYGARNYDPAIGRWMNIDPLAEQGRRWSPYNYAMDNSVYFVDPDGMWVGNPITSLISKATSAVKNYVSNKVSTVVSNTRNMVAQKARDILDKITPDIKIGKPEKAVKGSGFGVSFTADGGKKGALVTPEGERDTPQVDMTVVVGLTDVWGPDTNIPNIAAVLDTSNPDIKGGGEGNSSTMSTAATPEGEMITMKLEKSSATSTESWNKSEVRKQTKDTSVSPSQKEVITRMNKMNARRAEQEKDSNNEELQKKIDYYK